MKTISTCDKIFEQASKSDAVAKQNKMRDHKGCKRAYNGLIMTVIEELYKHLEVNDPEFWNAEMILDWAKENKQRFLDKEQQQLSKAWQEGAAEAQLDAAKEIENNYVDRVR